MQTRLPFFIFLFFCSSNLWGQEIVVDSVDGKHDFSGFTRDTVELTNSSMTEPVAQVVASPQNMTISSSTEVGQTAGELSVSPTGGATYTVPIAVPPGINGVQPEIALVYNSQGGNGLAGWGWNISGVSVITRISATKFHDDGISEVNFDSSDRFALDGQRLLLKSGTYGADGAQYETENFSNIKITSHGVSPYGAGFGPSYFKVTYPDGSFAYYGNSTNSRSRTDFAITYWQNPQGLRVSYTYILGNNGLSVSSVKYGAKGTATPINQIQFIYKTRKRPEQAYVGGVSFIRKTILSEIKVLGNGTGYRNYVLSHDKTSLGYERLIAVQEKSGDNSKVYDPITFTYNNTSGSVIVTNNYDLPFENIEQRNAEVVSLDYSGDGKMDFVVFPKTEKNKFWLITDLQNEEPFAVPYPTSYFQEIFPVTWLTHNNKILAGQGMAFVRESGSSEVTFSVYSNSGISDVLHQYTKTWNAPTANDYDNCEGVPTPKEIQKEYISGDFNGDGLTDIIAITKPFSIQFCFPIAGCDGLNSVQAEADTLSAETSSQTIGSQEDTTAIKNQAKDEIVYDPCCECNSYPQDYSNVYFINLDRRINSGFVTSAGSLQQTLEPDDKLLTADFNGDGKTDIMHLRSGKATIYTLNNSNILELLWETTDSRLSKVRPMLPGDYNGDGKTDIMTPIADESYTFALFLSNGQGFVKTENTYPFQYNEIDWDGEDGVGTLSGYNLIPSDMNGDGKTDVIDYRTITYNNSTSGSQTVTLYVNTWPTSAAGTPIFATGQSTSSTGNLSHFPIPIFLTSDRANYNLDFASLSNDHATSFQFRQDHREDVLLRSVVNHGLRYSIYYGNLDTASTNSEGGQVYTTGGIQGTYPNVEIAIAPGTKVVSELFRYGALPTVKQLFYYSSGVSNTEGLGFLGFRKTVKSNWHIPIDDPIFNTTLHDPALRGAVIKEFTSEESYIASSVQNADPNPSNITLSAPSTGTKTVLASKSVTLSPGFSANGADGTFIARTDAADGVSDGATLSDYITRTDYKYETQLKANKVFINVPTEVSTKDQLSGTNTAKHLTYDSYYNPVKEITYFSGQGSKEVNITYAGSTGSTYYIGRPTKKVTISRNGSDVFSSEEQYTYTGYLVTQVKSKGNNTSFITETRTYDTYGNLLSKTVAPPGETARTTSFEYDPSGRFIVESTDVNGLSTTYQYNLSTGNVTRETNPYNQSTDYGYDAWGKIISVTDYLGNSILTSYQRSGNLDIVTETGDDGSGSIITYDALGRKTKARTKNVMNQWVEKAFQYDHYDRPTGESEPYTGSAATQWSNTEYDRYGRVKKTVSYTGKTTNITYSGLSTTVNDGTKSVTTTKDALGNVVTVTDPGGTINYTYYANGTQKTASYSGTTMNIEQDGWGRKTKLTDPSAGVYTYSYNGFGEPKTETTPKGSTAYTYDAAGKLLTKTVQGDHTDMQLQYTYNATTKLLTSLALTNADGNDETYTYTYDTYKRPSSIVESNPQARFTRNFAYDSFGRVLTENFKAENLATAKTSIKKIKNTYQYGHLKAIADDATGTVIWSVTAVNARGQITGASFGSAIQQVNTYDQYGFPTELKTQKTTGGSLIAKFTTTFNAQRRTLTSRSSSLFAWNETFSYDNLDRLIAFNDPNGNKSQTYDTKGRITNNSAVGTYVYSGTSYRQAELNVIAAAQPHYQDRPLQQVSYNAFKSPVEIIEQGHERISFQYNASLRRAHMYYGGNEVDKLQRRYRKHYSSDGSMEITHDMQSGKTIFVTYIGGNAYSAPAIWREEHTSTAAVKALYYLQRDYLGSILAITDQNGVLKEKRHFDAWGNIVKLTNGSGTALTAFMILDRGYTGHEHLIGVGLIHMNGRLYDPMLHRFLSPDNYVQDLFNTQNFNRYAYALNNPLMYTDPDGEFIVAAIIGAVIGVVTNGINNVVHDRAFFKGAGKAALFGAIGGAASFGIGTIATNIASSAGSFAAGAFQAGAHSLLGGALSAVDGGNFWSGALAGGISSVVASGVGALGIKSNTWSAIATIGAGSVSGGIGSLIGGGTFWDGLRQGLLTSGLNHGAHSGWFGQNVAAALITQKPRHLFGPDARMYALTGDVATAAGVGIEMGKLAIYRGADKGLYNISDLGVGMGGFSAGFGAEVVDLYSSANHVLKEHFYGARWEGNFSLGAVNVSLGRTAIYSKHPAGGGFTVGYGRTYAFDVMPFHIGGNVNRGTSVEKFMDLDNEFYKALGF